MSNALNPCPTEISTTNNTTALQGLITWKITGGATQWDDNALNLLGLSSELEKNIYRNMDITDRVNPTDEAALRELLLESKDHECCIEIQLKHKHKHYLGYNLISQKNKDGQFINLHITLSDTGG
jgi:PAS domain-containing protein